MINFKNQTTTFNFQNGIRRRYPQERSFKVHQMRPGMDKEINYMNFWKSLLPLVKVIQRQEY